MTLPLTDTRIAELVEAGPGWVGVVVPTVPCPSCGGHGYMVQDASHLCPDCTDGQVLDPRWVEAAADTCTRCDGIGCDDPTCTDDECDRWHECPDCFEGSPWHPLTIGCEESHIRRYEDQGWHIGCEPPCSDGRVRVGRVAITTLAPYVDFGTSLPQYPAIERWPEGRHVLHLARHDEHDIRIVGTVEPGDTVAVCQVTT